MLAGVYDDIGKEQSSFTLFDEGRVIHQQEVAAPDHGKAARLLLGWIDRGLVRPRIKDLTDIARIGHRVVHGGDGFSQPVQIDNDVLLQIEELEELAPLHNASALRVIRAVQAEIESRTPMIAVFDTVFHRTMADEASYVCLAARYGAAP